MTKITKEKLEKLYCREKRSSAEIARIFKCSENKINYWLKKYSIQKRSLSDAMYVKRNPKGDPFSVRYPKDKKESMLYGLGLGLYWGEGNKKDKHSIRLGNTDSKLIKKFIKFLKYFYKIPDKKFKFGLQVFSDMPPHKVLQFWVKELGFPKEQFGRVVVTPTRGIGTYREKSKYGVLTVYISNIKLRSILMKEIEKL